MRTITDDTRRDAHPDDPLHAPVAAVSVVEVRKRYAAADALSGVSFQVAPGGIFGLLGPNGAGKTTTLECILGLRQPDSGSIRINGLDTRTHAAEAKRHVGAQLQAATLQDNITPRQALELFGSFYAHPFPGEELLARFGLEDKADLPFATLSGGQRQRLFLALAMINRPTLLVLDEPTAGLDPQARRTLHDLIRQMRSEGRTVLLSTHDLDEAAQLCDQVAIMDAGRIVTVAPPAELIAGSQAPVRVIFRTVPPLAANTVTGLPEVIDAAPSERGWSVQTRVPNRVLAALVRQVDEMGAELVDVEVQRPSLEDVFIGLTGHRPPGAESREETS